MSNAIQMNQYSHITFCSVSSKQECLISSPFNWESALKSQKKNNVKEMSPEARDEVLKLNTLHSRKLYVAETFVFFS